MSNGVQGLLPRGKVDIRAKVENLMAIIRSKQSTLDKYMHLHAIQDSEEPLYFAALALHTAELMPLVYTPTVGAACQNWHRISRPTLRGLYLTSSDKGNVASIIKNHPTREVDVIVFTDGERILGLGDLGVNGMGIPIGKLALYSALAGINPNRVLPVHIDVGTNNKELREDPLYAGIRAERDRSADYDALIEEFIMSAQAQYGRHVVLQFEDFGNSNAFRLLEDFRHRATTFNDDIQGTASVAVAGLMGALPVTFPGQEKANLGDHTYLFYGAGEAGVGIADLLCSEIARVCGVSMEMARSRVFLMDSKGLVHGDRADYTGGTMAHHKLPYAHKNMSPDTTKGDLAEIITKLNPTVLVGVSAQSQSFTESVVRNMQASIAANKESCSATGKPSAALPVIMALSNPTSKAECTAEQAYEWSNGKCVFVSGSPFDPVTLPSGKVMRPGQGNNAYIFPGVGLAAILAKANSITDDDFLVAARTVAECVDASMLDEGAVYPPLSQLTTVSRRIALKVARAIINDDRSAHPAGSMSDADLERLAEEVTYSPFEHYHAEQ